MFLLHLAGSGGLDHLKYQDCKDEDSWQAKILSFYVQMVCQPYL